MSVWLFFRRFLSVTQLFSLSVTRDGVEARMADPVKRADSDPFFSAFPLEQARGLARAQPESDGSSPRQHQARTVPDQPAGELGTGKSGDPRRATAKVDRFRSTQRDLPSSAIQHDIARMLDCYYRCRKET